MDTSKLSIASVKLINGGMKGIEVEYLLPSIKGNVQFFDTYKSKRKAPIHTELEETFSWLKNHMLDICGYTLEKEERDYNLSVLEMTGVKFNVEKGIILYADLFVLGGTRVLKLETPLITDEVEYPEFGKLKSIIEGIYAETKEYMSGKKVMSDMQIVARFNAKNEEFDHDSFSKMTKAEQREIATKILEDQGCMVFHNDEITTEEETEQVIDTTVSKIEVVKEEETEDVQELSFEEEQPKLQNVPEDLSVEASRTTKTPVITLTAEEDDFALPLIKNPVKKSTAKKKVA